MGGSFSFSILSVPFLVLALGNLAGALGAILLRGNGVYRVSLFVFCVSAMPWSVGSAFTSSCTDPETVENLARIYVGSVSFVGPTLMFVLLAAAGRVEEHRPHLLVATLVATASCALAWSTDLVVASAWETAWGLWFPVAGPLLELHLGNLVGWGLAGTLLARRAGASGTARSRGNTRRFMIVIALCALATTDTLLARKIGVYPFSVIPAGVAIGLTVVVAFRHDFLHSRGVDWAAAVELGVVLALAAAVVAVVWATAGSRFAAPIIVAAAFAPMFGVGQLIIYVARQRQREQQHITGEADLAFEQFVERTREIRSGDELAGEVSRLVESHSGMLSARLYAVREADMWFALGSDTSSVAIDARVRAWLLANARPLDRSDLGARRLGGLRQPIEALFSTLDVDVIVPLIDRGSLVGGIGCVAPTSGRALRDAEIELLTDTSDASAKALTYVHLFREAEARVEIAREVEVARAVQDARQPGESREQYERCEVVAHYEPSAKFGGDWWTSAELTDGRVMVVIGDVTGHGIPAALVSSTVAGACETAQQMWGSGLDAMALLQLLNGAVAEVGGADYAMSCFAAVFDLDAKLVTYANAGHPFPYVCRAGAEGATKLRSLVSRGTPLGTREPVLSTTTFDIEPDDIVVFYSDALVDSKSPTGDPYGDRRFQRVLRNHVRRSGARACEVIVEDARAHYDGHPIDDDLAVVVVRLGAGSTGNAV